MGGMLLSIQNADDCQEALEPCGFARDMLGHSMQCSYFRKRRMHELGRHSPASLNRVESFLSLPPAMTMIRMDLANIPVQSCLHNCIKDAPRHCGTATHKHAWHRDGVHNRMLGIDKKISFDKPMPEYDLKKFTALEVKAGTLIVLHHANVHYSEHNSSSKSRHAYSLHVVDGSDHHKWQPDNW